MGIDECSYELKIKIFQLRKQLRPFVDIQDLTWKNIHMEHRGRTSYVWMNYCSRNTSRRKLQVTVIKPYYVLEGRLLTNI